MDQSPGEKIKILIAEDEPATLRLHVHLLKNLGYFPLQASDGEECLHLLYRQEAQAVLLDINMPRKNGLEVLQHMQKNYPGIPVIMVTALNDVNTAVKAIKLGAFEYLTKPLDKDRLATVLRNAVSVRKLQSRVSNLQEKLDSSELFADMVGESKLMNEVFTLVNRVVETDVNILLIGESGTGKELVARAIHNGSTRQDGPFIAVNCSAITYELADSLFFGHKKGSFTGASEDRAGFFEQADGGTIFLDEIGDMELEIQAKILRILEERTVRRVGEKTEKKIDFRVIAATNHDLAKSIETKKFRQDLYFRLEEYPIYLPPLRQRPDDIPKLAQHFLKEFCESNGIKPKVFSAAIIRDMMRYRWPGNIRELKNVVRRSAIRTEGQIIDEVVLSTIAGQIPARQTHPDAIPGLDDIERQAIERAYHFADRNAAEAAKLLGISRATMYRKLRDLGVDQEQA